jgi:NADPH:quinone reductase-like Zn-dependent oxidoreductase
MRPLLTPRGTFVSTVPKRHIIVARFRTLFRRPRARLIVVRSGRVDLEWLAARCERGQLRAMIDRTLPLSDIAEAQRYLATRRARGKVVIRIA